MLNVLRGMVKLFLLLYADDIVLLAENTDDVQLCLDTLHDYCIRWKLLVNNNNDFSKRGKVSK